MVLGTMIAAVVALVAGFGARMAFRLLLPATVGAAGRHRLVSAYTWWTIGAAGLAAVVAAAVSAVSASVVDPALADFGFLAAIGVFTAAQVVSFQTVDGWYADGGFRRGSVFGTVMTVGGLAGLLAAAVVCPTGAALLGAQGVGVIVTWVFLAPKCRAATLLSLARPRFHEVRALAVTGLPTLGFGLGMAIALRADRYVLGAMVDAAAVGVFALAASLAEMPRLFPQALGQMFMRDITLRNRRARPAPWLVLSVLATAAANLVVVLVGWLWIVPVFGQEFAAARDLLLILAVAELCFAPYEVASLGLLGGGWTKTAGVFGLVSGVASVGCYLLSANLAGATGVAVGTVFLYTGLSLVSWLLLHRRVLRQTQSPNRAAASGPAGCSGEAAE
jgi:O-antigen/teichoic acid export membrane protein